MQTVNTAIAITGVVAGLAAFAIAAGLAVRDLIRITRNR